MGTWGTGISSNDVYEDINYQFFDLYNQGTHVEEITEKLIKDHKDLIESESDIKIWKELGASQSDLNKRRKVLNTFLLKNQ